MSKVKGKNTQLELFVRRELFKQGIGYRIHSKTLPGSPDISSKKNKIVVFIDGCFWHGCEKHGSIPKTNTEFWEKKIGRNIIRRNEVRKELENMDYTVLEYFECEIKNNFKEIIKNILSYFK